MSPLDFDIYQSYLKKTSGLTLTQDKIYLLESRLMPVARQFNLPDLSSLAQEVKKGLNRDLLRVVMEAMTTNETSFMRDGKPFDNFKKVMLPALMEKNAVTRKIRIWSSACSSGQEAYTLAMILREEGAKLSGWNIEIVGTDISGDIVAKAKAGQYSQFEVQRGLPVAFLMKYFRQDGDHWHIKDEIKNMVTYKTANLLEDFSIFGKFDLIFCRNVLIYFDPPTKKDILERFVRISDQNTFLVLGGAETVFGLTDKWSGYPQINGLYQLKK